MKKIKNILSFLILSIFIGCTPILNPKLISLDNIEVIEENAENFILSSDITMFNPNGFKIPAKDIFYNLYIDSLFVGQGDFKKGYLNKKVNSNLTTSISVKKNIIQYVYDIKDSISIKVLGSTSIPLIPSKYYFDFNYKIYPKDIINLFTNRLMEDVDLKILEIKVNKLNLRNTSFEIIFSLENKFQFECIIKKLDVKLYKTKNYNDLLGYSELKNDFSILSNSTNRFTSKLNVNTLKMGTAYFTNTINSKNSFFIEVDSKIEFNNIDFPFKIKKQIDYDPVTLKIELK